MRVPPPYVLIGHSWGGILIRGFSELYGREIAGLVYIETMDVETTRQEVAEALPEAERMGALEPPEVPTIPPDTPRGLRAEYENIQQNIKTDFAEARGLKQADWALESTNGLLIVSGAVRHNVAKDDPSLVAQAVRHVLAHAQGR